MNNSPEKVTPAPEIESAAHEALDKVAEEHREQLRQSLESKALESNQEKVADLHHKALEQAGSSAPEQNSAQGSKPERHLPRGPISKGQRDASFAATMKEVRLQMPAPKRVFSKVIHTKPVEKASEVTAQTIARPNAILSGAVAAFVVTLGVYLLAKNYGYSLSGFESIGAFVLGWIIGLTYDFIKVMVTGRK